MSELQELIRSSFSEFQDESSSTHFDQFLGYINRTFKTDPECMRVNWRDFAPDKYMVSNTPRKSDTTDPMIRQANGIVFQKETNEIVFYGPDAPIELQVSEFLKYTQGVPLTVSPTAQTKSVYSLMDLMKKDPDDFEVHRHYDGTEFRIAFNETSNTWDCYTKGCLDGRIGSWNLDRSFWDLFVDITDKVNFDFDKLPHEYFYTFILCHPENRTAVMYSRPKLVVSHIRNRITFEELTDYTVFGDLFDNTKIIIQSDTTLELTEVIQALTDDRSSKPLRDEDELYAIVIKNKTTGIRYLTISTFYDEIIQTLGKYPQIDVRIMELITQDDQQKIDDFSKIFPRFAENILDLTTKFDDFVTKIYSEYITGGRLDRNSDTYMIIRDMNRLARYNKCELSREYVRVRLCKQEAKDILPFIGIKVHTYTV
mgnify:CR=1 FL=1|jgi:hypothetical protein